MCREVANDRQLTNRCVELLTAMCNIKPGAQVCGSGNAQFENSWCAMHRDTLRMPNSGSRIDPSDTALLFVDLQSGIFELSKTVAHDRLAKGVLGLSRLAKIFGMRAIVSGVSGQNGAAPKMIPQLADGIGAYSVHVRMTTDSFRNEGHLALDTVPTDIFITDEMFYDFSKDSWTRYRALAGIQLHLDTARPITP